MGKLRNITAISGGLTLVPSGGIITYAGASAPSGWFLCDGSVVSQTTYADLFTAIGTTFNTGGEGVGNFRLPDLRQKFVLGKAASGTGAILGETGGAIDHNHSVPAHFHAMGAGADLAITSSGTHTTAIDHDHGAFTSGAGSAHTHGNTLGTSTQADHTHSIDHDHGAFTSGSESAHTHSIAHDHAVQSTSTDGSHQHLLVQNALASGTSQPKTNSQVGIFAAFDASGGVAAYAYDLQGGSFADTVLSAAAGSHSHTLDLPSFSGTSGAGSSHTHSIDVPTITGSSGSAGSHSHTITGSISNESAHTHSIDVPALTANSASTGAHTHASGDFSGRIGLVTGGVSGNAAMTSGSTNPPYCALNYIIKQ